MKARPPTAVRLAELEEVEVSIEKLVAGGEGLARFEGIPIFVPYSAPGDRLRVRVVERRPDYARGEILQILEEGEGRRSPRCPHFTHCGGCDLQHLEDGLQTRLKSRALCETLERLGKVSCPKGIEVVRGESWGYRLRTQLRTAWADEKLELGYLSRGSHHFVPVKSCPILASELQDLLPTLPEVLGEAAPRRLDLTVGDGGALSCAPVVPGLPHGEIEVQAGDFRYVLDARCFFQAHRGLLSQLIAAVVGSETGRNAYDLYAGVGLFGLPLARSYEKVVAVEGDRIAARFARKNVRRNRVANLEVVVQAVESWIRSLPPDADRVVVDPPRSGLPKGVRRALLDSLPHSLTYVSCHPAALARDLNELRAGYELERLILLDLFPQTGHLEAVAQLVRS